MPLLGREIRLKRLFSHPSGRIVVVAIDHAIGWGVIPGIEIIQDTLDLIVDSNPQAVTLVKGIANNCFQKHAGKIALILKSTSFSPYHPFFDASIASIEEAIRLGADAIAVGVTIGSNDQASLISNLARITEKAEINGMPVVCHVYPKGGLIPKDEQYSIKNVCYAARSASELGVDIVKTWYTGSPESFHKVVIAAQPSVVVLSGGPKLETIDDVFNITKGAIDAGAVGVTFGRNIWQSENPKLMISLINKIVHENYSVDDTLKEWKNYSKTEN